MHLYSDNPFLFDTAYLKTLKYFSDSLENSLFKQFNKSNENKTL